MIEAFLEHQASRAFARSTLRRRRSALLSFGRHIMPRAITEADADDVESWLRTLPTARTMHHYRSDLNCFYKWAKRRGIVERNPVDDTDPPRVPRSLPRPLKPEQIAAALMVADEDVRCMILLGSHAGLRCSEIARVHSDDVELGEVPLLVVRNGKGAKDRVVPLHPTLVSALRGRPAGWVFPGVDAAHHIGANAVRERIEHAFRTTGVAMTPHMLRHAFGTIAAQMANGNLLVVAMLMGHAGVQTTQGYVGWAPTVEARRVIESMYVGREALDATS